MNINTLYDLHSKTVCHDLSSDILKTYGKTPPVIVCLGTDKVLSDMVGVFVADILKSCNIPTYIFGGTQHCIDKSNIKFLLEKFTDRKILVVDSGVLRRGNSIAFSNITRLNDGQIFNCPCISASTIFIDGNKIKYAELRYGEVKLYAQTIANSILDYFSYLAILNTGIC